MLKTNSADKLILALDGMEQSEVFELNKKLHALRWVKRALGLHEAPGADNEGLKSSIFPWET